MLPASAWAADFGHDFKGRVSGLAYAAFKWLVMRVRVDTIKPDLQVLNFVETTLGFRLSDAEVVSWYMCTFPYIGMPKTTVNVECGTDVSCPPLP